LLEECLPIGHYCHVKVENDNRFHSALIDELPSNDLPLSEVPLNRWYRIERIQGPEQDTRRLIDLGFTPGEEVVVTHAAPLGDPIIIRVRGALLALRKREAAWIRVRF
jgi:ferrous iron transport protein A